MSYRHLAEALLLGKPYFGAALRARQGEAARHQYFLPVLSSLPQERESLRILEIGSWAGASAISWGVALQETGRQGTVTCVDPWTPYFDVQSDQAAHYRLMNDAAGHDLIFRLFQHNVNAAGVADRIEVRRGKSREVLPELPDAVFDVVYIDGSHAFPDVLFDIREAKRLLVADGVICGDDLELEASGLAETELRAAAESGHDFVCARDGHHWYHPGVTAAVADEFGPVAIYEGFWAARRSAEGWGPAVLDLTDLRIPEHLESEAGLARLVESTADFNFVEAGGEYFAISTSLGPLALFEESLGDRPLPPVLLIGGTLDEARMQAAALRPPLGDGEPALLATYRGFNLVANQGKILALRQSLGHIDVRLGEQELLRRYGQDHVFPAGTVELALLSIDARATNEHLGALRSEVRALQAENSRRPTHVTQEQFAEQAGALANLKAVYEEQASALSSLKGSSEQQSAGLSALHASLHEQLDALNALKASSGEQLAALSCLTASLDEQLTGLLAAQKTSAEEQSARLLGFERDLSESAAANAQTASLLKGYRHRVETLEMLFEKHSGDNARAESTRAHEAAAFRSAVDEARSGVDEVRSAVDDVRSAVDDVRSGVDEVRSAVDDVRSGVDEVVRPAIDGLARQQHLFGRQLSLLRYGPGDPQQPCVAGEHSGFLLVHYEGKVYGVRKGSYQIDDTPFRDLLSRAGAEDVVSGDTIDGLRARIDVLEDTRALRLELASVEQDIVAAEMRLTNALGRAEAEIKRQAEIAEALARRTGSWSNLLLRKFGK